MDEELTTAQRRELKRRADKWVRSRAREQADRQAFQHYVAELTIRGASAGAVVRGMGEHAPISRVRVWQIGREHADN